MNEEGTDIDPTEVQSKQDGNTDVELVRERRRKEKNPRYFNEEIMNMMVDNMDVKMRNPLT